jgi:hypothetical protein
VKKVPRDKMSRRKEAKIERGSYTGAMTRESQSNATTLQ